MPLKKINNFIFQFIINNLIRILSPFIKKKNNYWIFSMDGGNDLNGNVFFFLKYISVNHKNIKAICFLDKKKEKALKIVV